MTRVTPKAATARLTPITRQSLASTVVERLIEFIRSDPVGPGDVLPSQQSLAHQLGVSRPVLREAIQGLATLGVLDIRPGSGVYVVDTAVLDSPDRLAEGATHEYALDVLEARMVIEVGLAGMAAERAIADDIARMDLILGRLKRASARGQKTSHITSDFHRAIARSAHNVTLERLAQSLARARVAQGARVEQALPDIAAGEYESHVRLRDAVSSGDPAVARDAMRQHLEIAHGWENQIATLRESMATGSPATKDTPCH